MRGNVAKRFHYDIYGNETKVDLTIGANSYSTEKIFSVIGNLKEVIYPTISSNSFAISYNHNLNNLLSEVKNSATNTTYSKMTAFTPLEQVEIFGFGNNLKVTQSFNDLDQSYRLTKIFSEKLGTPNTTIQDISYSYDKVSNITQRSDTHNSFLEDYSYDDLYRLTSADLDGTVHNFSFDEIGNILSKDNKAYVYQTSRKQIVASVDSDTYAFDPFGNITFDAQRTYVFDWDNRLKNMTKNSQTTTYEYEEKGLRVRKITPTGETRYIDKYTEITPNGVIRHIYANDKLIASIDELGMLTFNFQDHLGSSNLRTDNTGNVLQRKEYLPFGGTRLETGSYQAINYGFTNQYEDKESGLYYYKQRYYNPELRRFITADPLYAEEMDSRGVDSQELNLYAYVRNNPLIYADPTGEHPLAVGAAIGFLGAKAIALSAGYVGTQVAANTDTISKGEGAGIAVGNSAFDPVVSVNAPQIVGANAVALGAAFAPVTAVVAAHNPNAASSMMSVVDKFVFQGQGSGSLITPDNAIDAIDISYDFGKSVGELINDFTMETPAQATPASDAPTPIF